MSDLADEELMLRYRAGNGCAFDLLCERYRGPVFAFFFRMLGGDRATAEDLSQDVFAKVAGAAAGYEPRAKFSTWLFTIARNHFWNHFKSRAALQDHRTDTLEPEGDGDVPASAPRRLADGCDTVRTVENRETAEILDAAIGRLPLPYREVFVLRAIQGLRHEQAAVVLGLPAATVRTRVHRACGLLRKEIGPLFDEPARETGKRVMP